MKHLKLKMTGLVLTLIWLSAMGTMAQVSGDRGNDIRFAGSISGIARNESGMAVQLTIEVSNAQVQLNLTRWTEVIQGQGFDVKLGDFQLNDYIEVSGFFTSTGNIVAREIHLRREDTLQSDGVVDSLTGQSITVNGVEFSVDEQSRIHAAGQVTQGSLAEIFVGDRVRVLAANTNGRLGVLELEYGERTIETEKLAFEGFVETMQNGLLTVDVGVPGTSAVVSTDTDTEIIGSIAGGVLVEVEGQFIPGTALVRASRINADNNQNGNVYDDSESDSQANDYEFDGVIQSLGPAGNGGEISEFSVGQTLVRIDGQTRIHFNDGANTSSSALQTGQAVDVKGTLKSDGSVKATEIEIKQSSGSGNGDGSGDGNGDGNGGGSGDTQTELQGTITNLVRLADNSVSQIQVSGTTVRIDGQTRIHFNDGANTSSSALQTGQAVDVKGTLKSDGSIHATEIEIK